MASITLPGRATSALTHMAGYGLAQIVSTADLGRAVRLKWSDSLEPALSILNLDWQTAAEHVHEHAVAHADPTSWLSLKGDIGEQEAALFSPRVGAISPELFPAWMSSRDDSIDGLTDRWQALDRQLIGALGFPSYWHKRRNGAPLQDHGASRWEMKTRNRGEEFVSHRLLRLATAVADRTPAQIASGLDGSVLTDELSKKGKPRFTATGLTASGPATDSALAWCALWGLSMTRVIPRVSPPEAPSITTGHLGRRPLSSFYLPLFVKPVGLGRLRVVINSRPLLVAATPEPQSQYTPSDVTAAWEWLNDRGVVACIRFPIHQSANKKAPELWARSGECLTPPPPPSLP